MSGCFSPEASVWVIWAAISGSDTSRMFATTRRSKLGNLSQLLTERMQVLIVWPTSKTCP